MEHGRVKAEAIEALSFPFDIDAIATKKNRWTKELSKNELLQTKKIAILGGSTTNELKELMRLFGLSNGFGFEFWESDYNRWYEDGVFGNESLRAFEPDLIYLYITARNIDSLPSVNNESSEVTLLLDEQKSKLTALYESLKQSFSKPIIINNFEYPLYRPLGNLEKSVAQGQLRFIDSINLSISEYVDSNSGVYLCDTNYLSSFVGLKNWYDERLWHSYKIATSFEATVFLSKELSVIMNAIWGKSKKCLALDLDNTLWGGVIGDDGVDGLELGAGSPEGEAFLAFQKECAKLSKRGVLLAVCSKNEYKNGIEGLNSAESLLKESDFAALSINWDSKDLGLQKIASELNIGVDAIAFADDNPAERHMVTSNIPAVGIVKMPENPSDYPLALDRCGFFESVSLSQDDLQRSRFYDENRTRESAKSSFADYGEYLQSLKMRAQIYQVDSSSVERAAQLLNKTNQFNLTMRRTDNLEVQNASNSDSWLLICGKLADKFGDNGLVGVVGGELKGDTLEIEWWVMSCRVFGRELELAMFDYIAKLALQKKCKRLIGKYVNGPKNEMVSSFYEKLGFTSLGSDRYEFDLASFSQKNRFIEVNNG